jgi:hypothetical protein
MLVPGLGKLCQPFDIFFQLRYEVLLIVSKRISGDAAFFSPLLNNFLKQRQIVISLLSHDEGIIELSLK